MLNVAAACYQNRRYSVGGTVASVGAHTLLLALFLGWLGFSADEPKGMLPPAFVLMPGVYQLESAPPEKAEGVRQVMSQPAPQPVAEPERESAVDKLAVSDQGTWARKAEKPKKKADKKPVTEIKMPETDNPSPVPAESTSAPRQGDSSASRADFTSHAPQPVSGSTGWESSVHSHLAKYKRYPRALLRYKSTGVSHVKVTLNMQGNVVSAELVNSSGTKLLDKEALATVQRASPFPLPPQERGRNGHIEIVTPIGFYL